MTRGRAGGPAGATPGCRRRSSPSRPRRSPRPIEIVTARSTPRNSAPISRRLRATRSSTWPSHPTARAGWRPRSAAATGAAQSGMAVRQLSDGVVEMDVGLIRLDIHVDDGAGGGRSGTEGLPGPLRFGRCQSGWLSRNGRAESGQRPAVAPGGPLQGHRPRRRRQALPARAGRIRGVAGGRGAGASDDDGLGRGPCALRHARHGPRSPSRRPGSARHLRPRLGMRPQPRRPRDPRRDPAPHPARSRPWRPFVSSSRRPRAGPPCWRLPP